MITKSSDKFAAPQSSYIFDLIEKFISVVREYESNESKQSLISDQTIQGLLETLADAL